MQRLQGHIVILWFVDRGDMLLLSGPGQKLHTLMSPAELTREDWDGVVQVLEELAVFERGGRSELC